ncbi:hypothetical protein K432DRAFT_360278 [Lepidopterella palustris CBS 459.81]|uniref:NACHT domain-containing protein n=1 Tax=Lepidopterella palustris CBS 459.81 TaxID=1314670 RepID=A0A8E2E393_9PEZI|nr:hypothetical protein K432DRAFT_360278 [Lepidopterella palustris CBS 459.81]
MLVTVAVSDQNTSDQLSTALADIVDSIGRCEDYQNLYPNAKRLEIIISKLYAEVINFLVRSKKYYETNGAVRVAKSSLAPFETKFGAILRRIEKLRQEVRDEVQLITAEVQETDVQEQMKLRKELLSHFDIAKQQWYIEDKYRQETSAKKREKNLRNIRLWLDATHFDHLRREKQWQDGTCEWITMKGDFSSWLENGAGALWVYGIPGCGKTVISTFLQTRLTNQGHTTVYFFCKNDDTSKRRPPYVVATLIAQLLDHPNLEAYQDSMAKLITKASDRSPDISKLSMDKLCRLLGDLLLIVPPLVVIIDALDECEAENLSRSFLIEKLLEFNNSIPGTRIIFTSRHEEPFIELLESCRKIEMSKEDVADDIEAVVRKSVDAHPKLRVLKDKIILSLLAGADGMFLWAELMLETLKRARNRNAVEKMLTNLPVGLNGVYEHILISIGRKLTDDELELRTEILGWVTTAIRPMTLEELSIALAIEVGASALDEGEIILRLENDVRELCGPMLKIMDDRTVQIVHMSVKDMLHRRSLVTSVTSEIPLVDRKYLLSISPESQHTRMAYSCVTYLAFEKFREVSFEDQLSLSGRDLSLITQENVLLEYATSYWIQHLIRSKEDGVQLLDQVLQFLESKNCSIWVQLMTCFTQRIDQNFSVHILMRSKLEDWVRGNGKLDDDRTAQILKYYLTQAMETFVKSSEVRLGTNNIQTLNALNRLGCLYDHEDRLDEAMSTQQKVVDVTSQATDPEAQEMFKTACIELAYIHNIKGNYVKSVEILELVLGGSDPSKWTYDQTGAEAMADLGVVYRKWGKLEKSREMAEKGAEGLTATLGPTHLLSIRYNIELCRTYCDLGLYDEAQMLLDGTLETADDVLGPEESVTLHGRCVLGNILHARGKLDEAETLLREVLKLFRQQWGENGRSTARLKIHVADVLVDKKAFGEAILLYSGATETFEDLLNIEHPETHASAIKLARCYAHLGLPGSVETVMVKYHLLEKEVEVDGLKPLEKKTLPENTKTGKSTPLKGDDYVLVQERDLGFDEATSLASVKDLKPTSVSGDDKKRRNVTTFDVTGTLNLAAMSVVS